jgi:Domain of Unknown Function (DUF1259)
MGTRRTIFGLFLGLMFLASPVLAEDIQPLNVDGIANAMGKQGELTGPMYKVSFPRSDLTVKIGNLGIKPALALINWAAFIKSGGTAVTYGDLVLLDEEINPVISKLEERGIELSALHNHLLHESPRIMYIHFVGRGDEVEMASAIREALAITATPLTSAPSGPETKPELAIEIERIIGIPGQYGRRRISHYRAAQ